MATVAPERHPAPSTFDVPDTRADDPVLAVLITARERYASEGTSGTYLKYGVCAVGALMSADENYMLNRPSRPAAPSSWEEYAREATKQALADLNRIAERRCGPWKHSPYGFGPIEQLNEGVGSMLAARTPFEERKLMVLACYDEAIAERC